MSTAEQSAITYATRTLGPEWETVLKISEALASGRRVPQIENLDDVEEQLRANVSVRDFENSEVLARVIIQEWKNARGNRDDVHRQVKMENMMKDVMSGKAPSGFEDLFGGITGQSAPFSTLNKNPEIQKAMDRVEDRKKSMEEATTEYGKQEATKEYQAAMDELNILAEGAMNDLNAKVKEAQLPRQSFFTAARIVALGRGCVDDAVYDHILSVTAE